MAAVGSILQHGLGCLATDFIDSAAVKALAKQCQVQPWVIVAAAGVWALGFLLWGFTGELVCSIAAYAYPTYASFKAVEAGDGTRTTGWLIYWITLYAWFIVETLIYRLVSWLPFYHLAKLVFILGLSVPNAGGAKQLYAWVLRPFLLGHQPAIDEALNRSFVQLDLGLVQRAARGVKTAIAAAATVHGHAHACSAVEQDPHAQEFMVEELQRASVVQLGKIRAAAAAAEGIFGEPVVEEPATVPRYPEARRTGARARAASPRPRAH